MADISDSPLGKDAVYPLTYDPTLLFPIPRQKGRDAMGLPTGSSPDCFGEDIWNAYEMSWLMPGRKPAVAMAEIRVPASSPNLIESKSMKLYFNSFNMSIFNSADSVSKTIEKDLSDAAESRVCVQIYMPDQFKEMEIKPPTGTCIDGEDAQIKTDTILRERLVAEGPVVCEELFSRLFRSNCPVTGQPDWAVVSVTYSGKIINHGGLLSYLISYRTHSGFHESCVEAIYSDIMERCKPDTLTVAARFTRRGGIDINPVRSSEPLLKTANVRDYRQ